MHRFLRRTLLRGVAASLLLPVLLAIVLGLGALLASLGDRGGALVCVRVAQAAGVLWLLAVVTTALTAGIGVLDAPPRKRHCRHGRHPGWHRRRHRWPRRHRHRADGGEGPGPDHAPGS